jgi:DTW domain-containing protein YfiP
MRAAGATNDELFEAMASAGIAAKQQALANRCGRCWHDASTMCICADARLRALAPRVPSRVLILMHHKEFLNAGDDAKLMLSLLPDTKLFVYGRTGDWQALQTELAVDPAHNLLLWPGDGATTVGRWAGSLPETSPWRAAAIATADAGEGDIAATAATVVSTEPAVDDTAAAVASAASAAPAADLSARPTVRVLVLDGVYAHARAMFRALRRRLAPALLPPHVALHPTTLSVYHRAGNHRTATPAVDGGSAEAAGATPAASSAAAAAAGPSTDRAYGSEAGRSVSAGVTGDPEALRICTVEAVALLLEELGEPTTTTAALVAAVVANNEAIACTYRRRGDDGGDAADGGGDGGGRGKKRRKKNRGKDAPGEHKPAAE